MEVDLSSNPKAIQQIEFVGQFKNTDIEIAANEPFLS